MDPYAMDVPKQPGSQPTQHQDLPMEDPKSAEDASEKIDGRHDAPPDLPDNSLERLREASVDRVLRKASHYLESDGGPLPATLSLIALIVLLYLAGSFPDIRQSREDVLGQTSFWLPWLLQGQYWRIVSANLFHANIWHVLSNAFALWIFGRLIEPMVGIRNMVLLFLLSGLLTVGISAVVDGFIMPLQPMVGASGIGYGVMAALFVFYILIRRQTHPLEWREDLKKMALLILVYVIINAKSSGEIAIWGHFGGFLGGVVYAWVYYCLLTAKARRQYQGWGIDTQL